MKKEKIKKIPVITYLCYLLAVSVLFTGVTFSRYSTTTSGDADVSVAGFVCSYEIENLSSSVFTNMDYWLEMDGTKIPTKEASSVRFTVRNQKDGRVSGVDLQASLRFYLPAELADTLALQMVEVTAAGNRAVTPQIVLSELIYDDTGAFAQYENESLSTAVFTDYNDRTDGGGKLEYDMDVTGGFAEDGTGTIVAAHAEGTAVDLFTISAARYEKVPYSVGFSRFDPQENAASVLYLHCEQETVYYTFEFSLPEMYMRADTEEEKTFILFLTSVNMIDSGDFGVEWESDEHSPAEVLDRLEREGRAVTVTRADGSTFVVNGFHFERAAPLLDESGAQTGTTTVRVEKTFTDGGPILSFSHVAPLSEGSGDIVHAIKNFYKKEDGSPASVKEADSVQNLYGICSNGIARIDFAGMTDDPFAQNYGDSGAYYTVSASQSKAYETQMNVRFVQASASGGGV